MHIIPGTQVFRTLDDNEYKPLIPSNEWKDHVKDDDTHSPGDVYMVYKAVSRNRRIKTGERCTFLSETPVLDSPICYLVDRILGLYGVEGRKTLPEPTPPESFLLNINTPVEDMLEIHFLKKCAAKAIDYPNYVLFTDKDLKKGVQIIAEKIEAFPGPLKAKRWLQKKLLEWLSSKVWYRECIMMLIKDFGYDASEGGFALLENGLEITDSDYDVGFLWSIFDAQCKESPVYRQILRKLARSALMSNSTEHLFAVMDRGFSYEDLREVLYLVGEYGSIKILDMLIYKGLFRTNNGVTIPEAKIGIYDYNVALKVFVCACIHGKVAVARRMLEKGLLLSPDGPAHGPSGGRDENFDKFVGQTVATGDLDTIKLVLDDYLKNIPPDEIHIENYYLRDLLKEGHYEVFKYLLETKRVVLEGEDGNALINSIIEYGNGPFLSDLLEKGYLKGIRAENVNDTFDYLVACSKIDVLNVLDDYWEGQLRNIVDIEVLRKAFKICLAEEDTCTLKYLCDITDHVEVFDATLTV